MKLAKCEYVVALNTSGTNDPTIIKVKAVSKAEALGIVLIEHVRYSEVTGWAIDGPDIADLEQWIVDNARFEWMPERGSMMCVNKIPLIKEVRSRTGNGLKEAKKYVDATITRRGLDLPF